MSNAIEQRVVEMRFDNSHFEKNVSTTMTTLEKLKQKLNLFGSSKSFDDLNTAAKNVNMNPLGNAVEAVSAKFSALQVMGVTALANITNSAINTGKNIVKSLTVDPVKSGFNEYELKMNSIQTIMAGTGESLAVVNQYLNDLNEYSDKTIYSFQDMTTNIGKFTNAGVKLEDAVAAIQGISNEAAVSGASAAQASHAMYNLAQALSSGYVKLIDWKSIENAQMATVEFKQQLIDAAVAAGTLKETSDGMYETIEGKTLSATKGFNDTLQDQWMTSEVLINTLKKYSDETTEIGAKATEAATKVKTFTQLMDTLKESAQSGWAQTWEFIVGDFEEARAFFTELSNVFGGIIGKSSDRRNSLISDAMMSNWDRLVSKINDAGIATNMFEDSIREVVGDKKFDGFIKDWGSLEKAVQNGAISSDDLRKALDGIAASGSDNAISEFAEGLKEIEQVLQRGNVGEDVKKLQTALDKLGYDLGQTGIDGIVGPVTEKAIKAFQEANGLVADGIAGPDTIAALTKAGKKLGQISENVDDIKSSCDDLFDIITEASGRELLLDSVLNVIKAIQRPLGAVAEAFRTVFSLSPDNLYNGLKKLNEFTKALVPKGVIDSETWDELTAKVEKLGIKTHKFRSLVSNTLRNNGVDVDELIKKYGSLGEAFDNGAISIDTVKEALLGVDGITESLLNGGTVAEKVRRSFAGLFSIFKILGTIAAGPLKIGFNVIAKILERMGLSLLDVTAIAGDGLVALSEKIDNIIDGVTTVIVDGVGMWLAEFKETEFFKTCAGWITDAAEAISTAVSDISTKLQELEVSDVVNKLKTFHGYISQIATNISNNETFIAFVDGICDAFNKLKAFITGFKLPELSLDNLNVFSKIINHLEGIGASGFVGTLGGIVDYYKGIALFNLETFRNDLLKKFVEFWLKTGDKMKAAFAKCKEVALAIKEFIFGTEEVNLPTILGVAEKFLDIILALQALKTLKTLSAPFDNITGAIEQFSKSLKWKAVGDAFKAMAIALGTFTICILILTKIGDGDMGKAWSAAGMLMALLIVMGGVLAAMAFLANSLQGEIQLTAAAASLVMLMVALVLLVHTIKAIDETKLKNPVGTFVKLGIALLALTVGIRMIAAAGGASFKSVAAILTLVAALKMILDVIDAYDVYNFNGKADAIMSMIGMMIAMSVAMNIATRGVGNGSAQGFALLLLSMVISLKILLGVIKDFAEVPEEDLKKGGEAVAGLMSVMGLIMLLLTAVNTTTVVGKGEKAVNSFKGLATALLVAVAAIAILGYMAVNHRDILVKGGTALGQILLAFTIMLGIVGRSCAGLKLGVIVTVLAGMALLLAEMFVIIYLMQGIPWQQSLGSAGAMALLMAAMATVLRTLNGTPVNAGNIISWIGAMAGLSSIMVVLGYVLGLMQGIPWQQSLGSAVALGVLILALAVVLKIISTVQIDKASILGFAASIIGLALIAASLFILVEALKGMNGVENAITNAAALAILAGALSVCLIAIGFAGKLAGPKVLLGVISFIGIAVAMQELANALASLSGVTNAIENATAIAILAGALSLCLLPLSIVGILGLEAVIGAGILVVLAGLLALVVWGLSAIKNVDAARANVETLSNLAIALTECLIYLTVVGIAAPAAIVGAGLLASLAIVLAVVVWGLSAIENTDAAKANVESMILLSSALTDMITQIAALGSDAITATDSISDLVKMVESLAVFAVVVGALSEHNSKLSGFVDTGLELFKKVARGIGEMILAFTGGLGLGDDLTSVAENLGAFADKIQPFVDAMVSLTDDVSNRATSFATAVKTIAEIDVGDTTLADLGTDLSDFATNVGGFITAMSGISPEIATSTESFCNAVKLLAEANEANAGQSFTDFSTAISSFATGMKDASTSFADFGEEDVANIQRAADAAKHLSVLEKSLPKKGGLWQDIAGASDLAGFGESIAAFADCLVRYSNVITEGGGINADAITNSATAAQGLSDLEAHLPKQGGAWQDFAGNQNIASFGERLVEFAGCLVDYSAAIKAGEVDSNAILKSAEAADALATLEAKLPTEGGWWAEVAGSSDIGLFGQKLTAFAYGLAAYAAVAVTIDDDKITAITNSGKAVDALAEVAGKIPESGGWMDKITGASDGQTFGAALSSMANGITSYCTMAATIGDDDIAAIQNTGDAITELGTVAENIPYIDTSKTTSLETATTQLKNIGTTINSLSTAAYDYSGIETLSGAITDINTIATNINSSTLNVEFTNLSTAAKSAANCADSLSSLNGRTYSGIETLKTALTSLSGADVDGVIATFSGKADQMASAVSSVIGAMVDGINNGIDSVTTAMSELIEGALSTIGNKVSEFRTKGNTSAIEFASGITGKVKNAKTAGTTVAAQAVSGASSKYDAMTGAGEDLGSGLVVGIENKIDDAYDAGYALGAAAVQGEKDGQNSSSPSKETIKAGKWLGEGLIIGIKSMGKSVYKSSYTMGKDAIDGISNSIRKVSDLVETGIDTNPTIRPVLDLSDVKSAAGNIGRLLDSDSTIGVMSNAGAVSMMMNRRSQNGANDDVVAAIHRLNDRLNNLGNTTYNVNGITYDDGSNITGAVKDLIRYAKIERRV